MVVKVFEGRSGRETKNSNVAEYLESLLEQLGEPDGYLEIHIFPTRNAMKNGFVEALADLSLPMTLILPDFATLHESFAGYPRIWISSTDLDLSDGICRARLQHEVGHGILHWEISAYLLGMPAALQEAQRRQRVHPDEASMAAYLLSVALKDYEVSSLLENRGITEDQIAFYLRELDPSSPVGEGIEGILGEAKAILGAHPFRSCQAIRKALNRSLGALEPQYRGFVQDLVRSLDPDADLRAKLETASDLLVRWVWPNG